MALGTLITPAIVSAIGLNGALLVMAFVPAALSLLGYPALAALDRAARARVAELAPRAAVLEPGASWRASGQDTGRGRHLFATGRLQ